MKKLIILMMLTLIVSACSSLERKFLNNPSKAAELCNLHYGCKDVEIKEVITYEIIRDTIKGDSVQCPDGFKEIHELDKETGKPIIDQNTGKPKVIYVPVPGEKIKCPDVICESETKTISKEVKVRDKAQDKIVEDLKIKNALLDVQNKEKRNVIIFLTVLISGYILYRIIKWKIKSKTKLL